MNEGTRAAALDYFGIKARNPRQGWSFINEEKPPPVIAVLIFDVHLRESLEDGIYFDGLDQYHENLLIEHPDLIEAKSNVERTEHLVKAKQLSNGLVRVIKVIPKNPVREVLQPKEFYPIKNRWFKLTRLDIVTGQFRLEVDSYDDI